MIARTHVSLSICAVLGCVVCAIAVGHVHHGSLRAGLMQARPWVYLAATYFLTLAFVRDRKALRAVLWAFVGTVGFKAVQGIYVWIAGRHLVTSTPSVKSAAYPRCQSCACQMAKAQARPTPCLRRLPTHPTESLAQKREQATDVRPPQGVPPSSAVRARERHLRS